MRGGTSGQNLGLWGGRGVGEQMYAKIPAREQFWTQLEIGAVLWAETAKIKGWGSAGRQNVRTVVRLRG